tara:strand:+ start:179 stop:619 length:441 start_codon:yes stop_codon:yes gene_type:complete
MAHLIQPITIDGVAYCCGSNGGRSTTEVFTEDYATVNSAEFVGDDLRILITDTGEGEGEVSIGVSCGSIVNIELEHTLSSSTQNANYSSYVDGVLITDNSTITPGSTVTEAISITGTPCGTIVTIHATSFGGSDDAEVIFQITSIT